MSKLLTTHTTKATPVQPSEPKPEPRLTEYDIGWNDGFLMSRSVHEDDLLERVAVYLERLGHPAASLIREIAQNPNHIARS
jgi:hypothetical protein